MTRAITLLLLAGLAGCASADPNFYVLQAEPGQPNPACAQIIEVRRPGLAGFLDRGDMVIDDSSYQLKLGAAARWAEPFGEMIERVLTQDLAQRLPSAQVFGEGGAIGVDADLRIDLDVQQFGGAADGNVTLIAQVVIERRHDHVILRSEHLTLASPRTAPGEAGLAAAMSTILGQLADHVQTEVTRLIGRAGLRSG